MSSRSSGWSITLFQFKPACIGCNYVGPKPKYFLLLMKFNHNLFCKIFRLACNTSLDFRNIPRNESIVALSIFGLQYNFEKKTKKACHRLIVLAYQISEIRNLSSLLSSKNWKKIYKMKYYRNVGTLGSLLMKRTKLLTIGAAYSPIAPWIIRVWCAG